MLLLGLLRALHLLVLALHLVFRHHHLLREVATLEEAVDNGDDDVAEGRIDGKALEHELQARENVINRAVAHRQELRHARPDDFVEKIAEEAHLDDVLEELKEVLHREDLLRALDRIELLHLGEDRVEGKEEADLRDVADDADNGRHEHEDERVLQDVDNSELGRLHHVADAVVLDAAAEEPEELLHVLHERDAHPGEEREEDDEDGRGDDVLRGADLALLPRVAQLLGRRQLGLLSSAFSHG